MGVVVVEGEGVVARGKIEKVRDKGWPRDQYEMWRLGAELHHTHTQGTR